uniref:Uncharacterized protein n=1 Tax=Anopheles farauti TaxID=69004 RepID=A0A182QZE7_9DIPT
MNTRLCVVLLAVAIATVKGVPSPSANLWAKVGSSALSSTPVRRLFDQQQHHHQSVAARNLPEEPAAVPVAPAVKKAEEKRPTEPAAKKANAPESATIQQKLTKLHEAFAPVVERKQRVVQVKTARSESNGTPYVPMFAKLILGDPAHPKLATVEKLRNVNWRNVETELELPTKHTIPQVDDLLQKTEELLRLFQDIQLESNGFVEDVQRHNENAEKEYIGYYN